VKDGGRRAFDSRTNEMSFAQAEQAAGGQALPRPLGRPAAPAEHDPTGIVWDIRKYTLHDGPGIRTTVFLKGCPLACQWCCNPESHASEPEIAWTAERCLACGRCGTACARDAIAVDRSGRRHIDRSRCDVCGACADECPGQAMTVIGREMTVEDVLHDVGQDAVFYRRSGGGLTLSGGEPLAQAPFAAELLRRYKGDYVGFHATIETCGEAEWPAFALVVPYADLFLYDIKHMDTVEHRRVTGVGNERILENAASLAAVGVPLVVRLPLVPGVNDGEKNLRRTADFARSVLRVDRLDLLPYHRLGTPKYARLGRRYAMGDVAAVSDAAVTQARETLQRCGLHVEVGG
jgi:pyruvate formate lyase activating enzyme